MLPRVSSRGLVSFRSTFFQRYPIAQDESLSLGFITTDRRPFLTDCLRRRFNFHYLWNASAMNHPHCQLIRVATNLRRWCFAQTLACAVLFERSRGRLRVFHMLVRLCPLAGARYSQNCGFHSLDIFRHSVPRRPNIPIGEGFGKNGETVDRTRA